MAKKDQPYLALYIQDFLTDERLSECSAASVGVYIKLMCFLHKQEDYGSVLLKQKFKQSTKQTGNQILDFAWMFACQIAKNLLFDEKTVADGLAELLQENVIQIEGETLYQKRMVKDGKLSTTRSLAGKEGGKKSTAKRLASSNDFASTFAQPKIQANVDNEIDNEIDNNNEIKKTKKDKPKLELVFPCPEMEGIWLNWSDYKKSQHNETYKTASSAQIAINNLWALADKNPALALEIVNHSKGNLWKGFFKPKTNGQQPGITGDRQSRPLTGAEILLRNLNNSLNGTGEINFSR